MADQLPLTFAARPDDAIPRAFLARPGGATACVCPIRIGVGAPPWWWAHVATGEFGWEETPREAWARVDERNAGRAA